MHLSCDAWLAGRVERRGSSHTCGIGDTRRAVVFWPFRRVRDLILERRTLSLELLAAAAVSEAARASNAGARKLERRMVILAVSSSNKEEARLVGSYINKQLGGRQWR